MQPRHADYGTFKRADVTADNRLERRYDMGCRYDRIDAGLRNGGMRAAPEHLDDEAVGGGHDRTALHADRADRQVRLVMHAEDGPDAFQRPAVYQFPGALCLLLSGLKQETNGSLQFPLAHPAVISVIPGGETVEEVRANVASFGAEIPAAFWTDLRTQGLVEAGAPVPGQAARG